jgi:MFS family permease
MRRVQSVRPSPALIIALISLPIFIGALDLTVISAVLPQVIYDLEIPVQTGLDEAAWLVSGYLLTYSLAMTFMGHLSDLYGRRRVYLLALAIFALGSYLVAVADAWPTRLSLRATVLIFNTRPDPARVSLMLLIVARMIQAFGGGAMVPVGMALVGDLYPTGKRAKPLGVIAAVDTAGWVVGHLYGGIIVRYFKWQTIFWLNLPVCIVTFLLVWIVLGGHAEKPGTGRMDWVGVVCISLWLVALNVGLGARSDMSSSTVFGGGDAFPPYAILSLAVAAVFLVLFIWRQVRVDYPLVPLKLFKRRNFSAASLTNFLIGFSLFIAIANVPLFINTLVAQTLEQGAWDSGWMLSALTIPIALAAIPGGWLTSRRGYRWPTAMGLILSVMGFALMNGWRADTPYGIMAPHLFLAGIGFGLTMAPIAAAVVDAAPEEYRGTASGLVIIFRLIGMTLAVSSMTTYGLHRSRVLSAQLLSPSASLSEIARVGMKVAVIVIDEIFLIAGIICALALIPGLWLKRYSLERSSK